MRSSVKELIKGSVQHFIFYLIHTTFFFAVLGFIGKEKQKCKGEK